MDSRTVICNNIINIINSVDDRTLREIERMVKSWLKAKEEIAARRRKEA